MASYGASIRRITTAEINRVLREGQYSRWAYFVDEQADKTGVIFANDTEFAAYSVDDSPDPKLHEFGHEKISGLIGTPDPELLVLTAGGNDFTAVVFNDPMVLDEDDFTDAFSYDVLHDWQHFLGSHGLQRAPQQAASRTRKVVIGVALALALGLIVLSLVYNHTSP